jgi:hypothetical protein
MSVTAPPLGLRPRKPRRVIGRRHRTLRLAAIAAGLTAVLAGIDAIVPSEADILRSYILENAQSLSSPHSVVTAAVSRESYSATPGVETLVASGTNHDWAKMVLLFGEWPMTEANVTVITRWMRQENGYDNWWNRNNPLNNGYGSGGGGGTGSYDSLVIAAQKAAENLGRHSGYVAIRAALAASSPTDVTERAIWASPWASGHYDNGGHWSSRPVPVVKAPVDAWS